jgi:hypothetical protein
MNNESNYINTINIALGTFYVTQTTFQNLLVKTNKGNHPVVLGPLLIH